MIKQNKNYNVKVPSSSAVTMGNTWEILKVISKTGRVFLDSDLVKNGSPVNEKNLFRILSYLKYLGFIYERRERVEKGQSAIQRWYENESKEIKDFFFFLRDGRENQAKEIFIKIIFGHDLFKAISSELLDSRPSTKLELKDYFRRKLPDKSVGYYDNGVKVTLDLLKFCNLIEEDGNFFKLKKSKQSSPEEETAKIVSPEKQKETVKRDLGNNKYHITITGEDTNFEFPINNFNDLVDVEAILGIIKRKLS